MTSANLTPKLRILLAEDNSANRMVARALLKQAGHTVHATEDGIDALNILDRDLFDLIVLDVMMPVLDGLRTLRRIKRRFPMRTEMPIFALTAHTGTQDQQRYRLAGFDAVVAKPLRQGDIETAWRQYHSPQIVSDPVSTPQKTSETPSLLDMIVIDELRSATTIDRRAIILASYWASTEKLCIEIKAALPSAILGETKGLTDFRRSVHTLKGASLSIGAFRVAETARILRNAPPARIPDLLNDLIQALLESRSRLSEAYSEPALDIRTG